MRIYHVSLDQDENRISVSRTSRSGGQQKATRTYKLTKRRVDWLTLAILFGNRKGSLKQNE
jgi:hypothetical protein